MSEINPVLLVIGGIVVTGIILVLFQLLTHTISRRWNKHKAETVDKWEAEGIEFVRGPSGGQFGGLESMVWVNS